MSRIHVQPRGILRGPAAEAALSEGHALPLGDGAAFTAAVLMERTTAGNVAEHHLAAARLPDVAGASPDLAAALDGLGRPVRWPASLPPPPLIMGVVNVTPDSFYDGGRWNDPGRAIEHGRRLAAEGASLVDVGGESTRPGSRPVDPDEERARVEPVVRALAAEGVRVSIDTRRAPVMAAALDAGASVINDVSAFRHDGDAVALARRSGVPVVLMHMLGEPATMQQAPVYERASLDVLEFLLDRASALEAEGIRPDDIILDPGIGFGKTVEHNLDILRHLGLYRAHRRPVTLGVSRKSLIGRLSAGEGADDRLPGTLAIHLALDPEEVQIQRVHDVAALRQAISVRNALNG